MKIWKYEISNDWLSVGAVAVMLLIVVALASMPKSCSKEPTTPQQLLNESLAIAQAPLLAQIADQKKQISDSAGKLTLSENKYKVLASKYVDLERRKNEVKAPVTNTEIRDRFTALGYVPMAVK